MLTQYKLVAFDDTGEWVKTSITFHQYMNLTDDMPNKSIQIPGGEYDIKEVSRFYDNNVKYVILKVVKKQAPD